jgi:hypothetical protein
MENCLRHLLLFSDTPVVFSIGSKGTGSLAHIAISMNFFASSVLHCFHNLSLLRIRIEAHFIFCKRSCFVRTNDSSTSLSTVLIF